jgi:NAD-dependent deacetylase
VYEVHGHLREATCIECYHVVEARPHLDALVGYGTVPRCSKCNGIMKPNAVLIGEQLPAKVVRDAQRAARKCELMLVAGSSLTITPAAGLPRLASANGARLVVVNYEPTYIDGRADVVIHDDVADILPRLVKELEAG